ncbi:GntR family transcriptional regulator [Bacillus suaedae]|uniref:GntR family transcriptional regulator n=1 Tax=Halalkalibacter suaedae TaxID=2822140 RepID=A0A940X144_9BACI|nr:GntR family transcriptional regulator [Bacillus suaedae]MBP3952689.1 GntR family transcriptional regulator [Bacillus suaedae]
MIIREEPLQHLEIAEYLINQVQKGIIKAGQKIPSENDLCEQFHVNRHVVRQAIARLTNLGWVTPQQGKGCYVNCLPKPILYVLSSQTRFTENMETQGVSHESKLIHWEIDLPDLNEQESLQLDEREYVYRLDILRYINEQPLSITTSVFPCLELPRLEQHFDHFDSLYGILLDHYQLRPIRSHSMFQACLPTLKDTEHLKIPENIPIIRIESVMNHPSGFPIEYSVARVRGDMQKCVIEF